MKLHHLHEDQYDDLMGNKPLPDQDVYGINRKLEQAKSVAIYLNRNGAFWGDVSNGKPRIYIKDHNKPDGIDITPSIIITNHFEEISKQYGMWIMSFGINYEDTDEGTMPYQNLVYFDGEEWQAKNVSAKGEGYNEFRHENLHEDQYDDLMGSKPLPDEDQYYSEWWDYYGTLYQREPITDLDTAIRKIISEISKEAIVKWWAKNDYYDEPSQKGIGLHFALDRAISNNIVFVDNVQFSVKFFDAL